MEGMGERTEGGIARESIDVKWEGKGEVLERSGERGGGGGKSKEEKDDNLRRGECVWERSGWMERTKREKYEEEEK